MIFFFKLQVLWFFKLILNENDSGTQRKSHLIFEKLYILIFTIKEPNDFDESESPFLLSCMHKKNRKNTSFLRVIRQLYEFYKVPLEVLFHPKTECLIIRQQRSDKIQRDNLFSGGLNKTKSHATKKLGQNMAPSMIDRVAVDDVGLIFILIWIATGSNLHHYL